MWLQISTSCGGGYCDCGDADAWKQGAACTEHDKANQVSSQVGLQLSSAVAAEYCSTCGYICMASGLSGRTATVV